MHALKPTVYRLPVHLEDQQLVYYNPDDNPNEVLERGANKETQLTAWFKINQSNPMQGIPLIRIFLRLGFTIPKQKFGSQDNMDKPSVACTLHLHLLANGFIFNSFSLLFWVPLLLLICALSTTSHTILSKKLALLLGCWRMIMSGYSVLEKLAKCRQVTLFACSLLPFSSIAIQPQPGFFGISSSTISVMISCIDLQTFIPTVTLLRMKFTIMAFISLIMSFAIGEHSFQIFQACHRS